MKNLVYPSTADAAFRPASAAFGTPPGDLVHPDAKYTPSSPRSLVGKAAGAVAGVSAKDIYEPQTEPRYRE